MNRYILIIITIFFLVNCSNNYYNYEYSIDVEGEKKTLAKGHIDNNIPNGQFEIFSLDNHFQASGNYKKGQKKGDWKYLINSHPYSINWNIKAFNKFKFSIPNNWKSKVEKDNLFRAVRLNSDSLIIEQFRIIIHQTSSSFEDFNNQYYEEIDSYNFPTILDYSEQFIESYNLKKMTFKQCFGKDQNGVEIMAFLLIFESDNILNQIIEVSYVVPFSSSKLEFYTFVEIILDLYLSDTSIFDRWGLNEVKEL